MEEPETETPKPRTTGAETNEPEPRPRREVWGPWATMGWGLVIGVCFLLAQAVVVGVFAAIRIAEEPGIDLTTLLKELETHGMTLALATIASTVACVGLITLLAYAAKGLAPSEYLGLKAVRAKSLFALFLLVVAFAALSDGLSYLLGQPIVHPFMLDAYKSCDPVIFLWIAICIGAPLAEEFLFRGFLLEGLRRSRLGNAGAIILTSVIWALIHLQYDSYGVTTTMAAGVMLGIVRVKTGSLWSVVFMHAVMNVLASIETALVVNGVF